MKNNGPDLSSVRWRKSSYSNGGDANCIEVSDDVPGLVPVRDSKVAAGPALVLTDSAWGVFVEFAKAAQV